MKYKYTALEPVKLGKVNYFTGDTLPEGKDYTGLISINRVAKTEVPRDSVTLTQADIDAKKEIAKDGKRENKNKR